MELISDSGNSYRVLERGILENREQIISLCSSADGFIENIKKIFDLLEEQSNLGKKRTSLIEELLRVVESLSKRVHYLESRNSFDEQRAQVT